MDVIERLTKQGKDLGYEGETLQTFVKEQQIELPYVYIMFPATTAATAVRNVVRRVIWSFLSWNSSSVKYHYVSSRSIKVSVTNRGLYPRRHGGALRLSSRYVTDACTFPHGLLRYDGTSHVSLLYYQGLSRLSSPVKAHYG